jgi:hypothetical protein
MADFPGMILTAAGRQLQAKAQIGQALTFTRVALGSGATPAQPEALTAMVDEEKSLSIQSFEVLGDGTSKMRVILTNQGVTEGFFVTEIGVFARDPDTLQEHLYSYSNSGAQSDFMPAEGGATVVEQTFDLITVIGTAQNVTAKIDDFITIATKKDVDKLRPFTLPAAGTVGQLLRKSSNDDGATEWFDPAAEGYDLRIASVSETREAIQGQTVFNLKQTVTGGLAIYVDGLRLRADQWVALNDTQVRLETALNAGQHVEFLNNEEVGAGSGAGGGGSLVTLDGPSLVYPGTTNTFTITNFDGFSVYGVATDVGTVAISAATITLTLAADAPAGPLSLSVTRNGATVVFQIAVGAQSVAAPSILNPTNGATGVRSSLILTTSAFLTYPNGADTHASTDWQLATDAAFTAMVWESAADAANLEAVSVPSNVLTTSTTYYARSRHKGTTLAASGWSPVVSFTMADSFYPKAEVAKLQPATLAHGDHFGRGVGVFQDTIAVTDKKRNVYIYEANDVGGYVQVAKILMPKGTEYMGENDAVAVCAGHILVGDRQYGSNGLVTSLRKVNGVWQVGPELPYTGSVNSHGWSIVIHGDRAFIGKGRGVEIWRLVNDAWTYVTQITSPNNDFGSSVSFDGEWLAVGDMQDDTGGLNYGAVSLYRETAPDTFTFVKKLHPASQNGGMPPHYGTSCAITDGMVAGGAPYQDTHYDTKGAVFFHTLENGDWVYKSKRLGDRVNDDHFGRHLAADAGVIIASSENGGAHGPPLRVFQKVGGNISQVTTLLPSDLQTYSEFGHAIAIQGGVAVVADLYGKNGSNTTGAVYVFK